MGGPVATRLVERNKLRKAQAGRKEAPVVIAEQVVEDKLAEAETAAPGGEDKEAYILLKSLVILLVAMWIGSWVSPGFRRPGHHPSGLHRSHGSRPRSSGIWTT